MTTGHLFFGALLVITAGVTGCLMLARRERGRK